MGQILGAGKVFESKIAYPPADMHFWFLTLGAKRKITYPPADMQFWYLALGAKRKKITYPPANM
jgi:hypothetical protein